MVELSNERIEQILHDETKKTEDLTTLLRSIYIRYMNLFETYCADMKYLNDDKIAELRKNHEETKSLVRYYFLDIPYDVCKELKEFEEKTDNLLGREWRKLLNDALRKFKDTSTEWNMSDDYYMAEFKKKTLKAFYENMENIFREGFGTNSETARKVYEGISGMLFGSKDD